MKRNIIYGIVVCLTAFALSFMMACSSQEQSLPEYDDATLLLNIATIDATRAATSALPDNEKMHSVRIVILHPDGTVEHNKFYQLDGPEVQTSVLLKVTPSEKKQIYIFANEESVDAAEGASAAGGTSLGAVFDSYGAGASGFAAAADALYFAPDYTGGRAIPMSAVYEVDTPAQGVVEKTFHVVRAATRFTCLFKNFRSGAVTVNSISVSDIANISYLMAHKQYQTMQFTEADNSVRNLFWIDWLKIVSDESQKYPDDKTLADKRGWIMDYDIPGNAVQAPAVRTNLNLSVPKATATNVDQEQGILYSFYLPESKNLIESTGRYGEQKYDMTLNLTDEYGDRMTFNVAFDNLKALFRNTNVVIEVTMYDRKVEVDVIPYSEVILEPVFGL